MEQTNQFIITCVLFFLPTLFQVILLVVLIIKVYCRSSQSIAFDNDIYSNPPPIGLNHFSSSRNLGINNVYESQPRQSHASVSRYAVRGPSNLQQIPVPSPTVPIKTSHYDIPAQLKNENLYDKIAK